jgi:cell division protein FtsQ
LLGSCVGGLMVVRNMLLHDDQFVIQSSSSIAVEGNQHLTKAQLLSIFGEDVERNVFTVSLAERKADLERLPWVEHATVMRLLPDHLRVSLVERTPVAFVRQGSNIGLVDKSGVLLDMAGDSQQGTRYSFPVVTGIAADDPLSTREARMKIYERFTSELDAGGEKISQKLSEVDLSSPEDVKALIPDNNSEILVHFGDRDFLDRYQKYQAHLAEWRTQYPKLSSVDMRYDRQVVLEMQPGSAVPTAGAGSADTAGDGSSAGETKAVSATGHSAAAVHSAVAVHSAAVHSAAVHSAAVHAMGVAHAGAVAVKATPFAGSTVGAKPVSPGAGRSGAVAYSVPVKSAVVTAKPHAVAKAKPAVKRTGAKAKATAKHPARKTQGSKQQYHPPTVVH